MRTVMDDKPPTDDELKARTAAIVARAEAMAAELAIQNEKLAATLDMFRRDVVEPLRILNEDERRDH
jgi:hypothetical protein